MSTSRYAVPTTTATHSFRPRSIRAPPRAWSNGVGLLAWPLREQIACFAVSDTLSALQHLASRARLQWGGQVIGVTGSAGKTTTKDAIAHLLSTAMSVGKTIGNLNNHVGVPLSILRLPDRSRAAVLEMGMNHGGEIRDLAAIARPDIGVVTNVGYAHVEFFDSIEGVAAAKRELIEGLAPAGVAVLNADDPRVARFADAHPGRSVTFGFSEAADVRAENAELRADGSRFRVGGVAFETGLAGRHAVMNLLAAIAVAGVLGIAPERLRDAVRTFTAGRMRGERIEHNGIVVWDDCYNSNPEAAQSMLDVLRETPAAKRVAVLGEMLELGSAGEELHRRVGRYAAARGIDLLIGVRGSARAMVAEAEAAGMRSRVLRGSGRGRRVCPLPGAPGRCGAVQGFARRESGTRAGKVPGLVRCSTGCSTNNCNGTSARFASSATPPSGPRSPA